MPRDDQLARAAEHPVVRRLRHRRLLAFLRHQGLEGTFESMVHETEAFFSVAHLQDLMKQGQWRDALAYLSRFLQLDDDRLLSLEAQVLYRFLNAQRNLADILAGNKEGRVLGAFFSKYRIHDRNFCHGNLRLKSIMLTALHAKQLLRVSWERVRHRAAEIAHHLVYRTPELKDVLPPGPMKPQQVLPIRTCNGRSYCRKKHPSLPRAFALAQRYLGRRRSLLSSSRLKEPDTELYAQAASWTADILDESLKAGKPQELHQKQPLQTSGNQDATVAPCSKTSFGRLAGPAKNLDSTSAENAGKVACHVRTPGAPFVGTMLSHCDKFGTSLMANTSAPVAPVTRAMNLTSHAHISGTNNCCRQEGCIEESAHLGFNPRKEPTTSDEQDLHPKRQRTTGTFGETNPVPDHIMNLSA